MSSSLAQTNKQVIDEASERARIDSSLSKPVLFLYATALVWLLIATLFGFSASIKLHRPEFLSSFAFATYGRVWPAYLHALAYGWASLAGLGTALWMLGRLCRVPLSKPGLVFIGGVLWNIGVLIGIVGILAGNNSGFAWMEFSRPSTLILLIGYLFVAISAATLFRGRRAGYVYITVWYLMGALLWFPWNLLSSHLLAPRFTGVMHSILEASFAVNLHGLWFGALGLGFVYYLIPKVVGRAVYSHPLATIGFWSYAVLFGWTATTRLVGGPLPAWQITVGITAAILLLITVASVGVNYALTLKGGLHHIHQSPTLRFSAFGAVAWCVVTVLTSLTSFRSVARIVHFTVLDSALGHLLIYGFFSMVVFGCMYFIVPRLTGCEWLSGSFIRLHFWGSAYGIGLISVMLAIGGFVQGNALDSADVSSVAVTERAAPFLVAQSIGWLLLIASHFVVAFHFALMLLRKGQPSGQPTLFASLEEVQS